jgi:hypothetical protein
MAPLGMKICEGSSTSGPRHSIDAGTQGTLSFVGIQQAAELFPVKVVFNDQSFYNKRR